MVKMSCLVPYSVSTQPRKAAQEIGESAGCWLSGRFQSQEVQSVVSMNARSAYRTCQIETND